MTRVFRWLIVLAAGGVMAATCLGAARTADPRWAVTAFQSVVPAAGIVPLSVYLTGAVLLPFAGVWLVALAIARHIRFAVLAAVGVGICVGVYVDYLQLALPFAGDALNVPGLPIAMELYGHERLGRIWQVSFVVNIAAYALLGGLFGVCGLGRSGKRELSRASEDPRTRRNTHTRMVRRTGGALVLIVGLLAAGLWRLGPGNAGVDAFLAQFDAAAGVRYLSSVSFDRPAGEDLRLDLCMPARLDSARPAVVCIHGGGWRGGTRAEYAPLIVQLARRGYVAITIDYRLAPKHRFPAQAQDVRAAVRWLREQADELGVDAERIGLLGWSAGGHLACFVGVAGVEAYSPLGDSSEPTSRQPSADVQAVVSFSGLTDLTANYWNEIPSGRKALVGWEFEQDPAAYRAASPLAHVDRNAPPFLLLHGSADPVVPIDQSERFRDALDAVGGTVSLRGYAGQGHRWYGTTLRAANSEAFAFLDRRLKRVFGVGARELGDDETLGGAG